MDEITHFIALPYDRTDGELVPGQQAKCASPAAAIEHAKHLWKTFGHAGAAAVVRTGHPGVKTTVLRTYGMVPNDLEQERPSPDSH
ncbi:hypothetical protein ABIF38_003237 [Bradyrhizobium japonicum]|jgi:hypothetical protein|uniref:Uncharacterized protein n=1 Tax=Bradyrhizobium elkanii TaxID=29448 RepID=A0ABV4FBN3_BRAEL|nr:hypothetical protein [Bradyrhizobium elkanii]MBP2432231.1 hypothetical protein [Bradyrhizobium elkanii]MCP1734447.1 hypothetical protein [Bradyrhizobium elkanii]MCP1752241.1 hypothetical protein [Bradyrhizobium elkanii]MCP1966583.1 hypothetical protein [Bradyrhizobium elkanii]MCP1978014.1 hypothetical protein [Bradyrhizobium elkanii]